MNLDSIKIKLHLEDLDFDSSQYSMSLLVDPNGEVLTKFILSSLVERDLGLSSIELFPFNNEVVVQCSSKVLREDYLEGINMLTLWRLHSVLNKYISCSMEDLFCSSLLRGDITENIYFGSSDERDLSLRSLVLGKGNSAFKVDDFTGRNESIIYTGRQRSWKNRLIIYNKELELRRSCNSAIRDILDLSGVDYSCLLRFELNVASVDRFRRIIGQETRKGGGVEGNRVLLRDVLLSNDNPIGERLDLIMKHASGYQLFNDSRSWKELIEYGGMKWIFEMCDGSLDIVLALLKSKVKKQSFYNWRKKIHVHHTAVDIGGENLDLELIERQADVYSWYERTRDKVSLIGMPKGLLCSSDKTHEES